jgi:hypothetical protein
MEGSHWETSLRIAAHADKLYERTNFDQADNGERRTTQVLQLGADILGTRYLATLLGISFVVHQVGSSLGAWGGGVIFDLYGSYDRAWSSLQRVTLFLHR